VNSKPVTLLPYCTSGAINGPGSIDGVASAPLHLTIGAAGVIDGNAATGLTLDTFTSIVNAGTIESTGSGGVVIDSPVVNTGTLSVKAGGTLAADAAVSGNGVALIKGGALEFLSSFDEAVGFTGGGTLELARSQAFTKAVTGFSATGATALDLRDIGFVDAGEATFSGTSTSGVLTVSDGTHTASITLKGDYLAATFVASSDGGGGTDVVAQAAMAVAPSPRAFVAAMAGLGPPAANTIHGDQAWPVRAPPLTSPRAEQP
jgi:hypothetical protein